MSGAVWVAVSLVVILGTVLPFSLPMGADSRVFNVVERGIAASNIAAFASYFPQVDERKRMGKKRQRDRERERERERERAGTVPASITKKKKKTLTPPTPPPPVAFFLMLARSKA